jgi:hypothetical protein
MNKDDIHNRHSQSFLSIIAALVIIGCFSCHQSPPNPSRKIETAFVQNHFGDASLALFSLEAMGTDECMNPNTQNYDLFLQLHSERFDRHQLDQKSDSLAYCILREIMPAHHLKSQISKLLIRFNTPTQAFDSTRHFRKYRNIHFKNLYHFSGIHIDSLNRSNTDTTFFEKSI